MNDCIVLSAEALDGIGGDDLSYIAERNPVAAERVRVARRGESSPRDRRARSVCGSAHGRRSGGRSNQRRISPDRFRPYLVYPLMLLGFGYNEESRIATVAFGALGMVLLPVASALSRVPAARADVGGAAGTSPPRGAALAHYRRAVRALAAPQEYRPECLWLATLLAGALNAALSSTLIAIERRLVHWQPE
jgi:hypothetical protein